jgi:hypothetical protein
LYIFPLSLSFSLFIARFKQLSPSCEKYTTLYLQYIYNLLLKYQSHEILEEAATNNKVEYGYLCLKYNQYKCIIIIYNTHTMFLNVSEYKTNNHMKLRNRYKCRFEINCHLFRAENLYFK